MRIKETGPNCYSLWLSARDTENWATRPDTRWPLSSVRGSRVVVCVDSNGLCDLAIDGQSDTDCDGSELEAIVADHLPARLRHLWPCWETPAKELSR